MSSVDEWRLFISVASFGSFIRAARAHQRSPQAVTRAIASLEARLGTRLLHRTTRSVSLTDDGERYLERSRRAVAEIDSLEAPESADAKLRGQLSVTAPVLLGQIHVAPIVSELLSGNPALDVRLALYDRVVSLADEGIDVGVRIGALPDSSLRARLVGAVRWVVCASPEYLARAGRPRTVDDLTRHSCIAFSGTTPIANRWSFARIGKRPRAVAVRARLTVNTGQAAIDAALAGIGIVRVLSYQVDVLVREEKLRIVLPSHEPPSVPVHLVQLPGVSSRAATAFVELASERLRARLGMRAMRARQ